jgi:hypothetical protein
MDHSISALPTDMNPLTSSSWRLRGGRDGQARLSGPGNVIISLPGWLSFSEESAIVWLSADVVDIDAAHSIVDFSAPSIPCIREPAAVDVWIATQFTRIMRTGLPCEIRDVLPNFPAQFSRELLQLTFERAPVDTAAQSLDYVWDMLCQLAGRWRGVRRSRAISATGSMESG